MADINKKLKKAAMCGFGVDIKSLLMVPGCDPLHKDSFDMTALMCAAQYGHEACVELLLPSSDASAQAVDGMTALMYAARMGHEACVKLLLPVSDVLAKSKSEATASDYAKFWGHENTAQSIDVYVLARTEKADIDAATSSGVPRGRPVLRV